MTGRQTAGIVTAPGGGEEVAVVVAVGATGYESHVGIVTVVPVSAVLTAGESDVLEVLGLIVEVLAGKGEATAPLAVGGGGEEGAHGVLAEGAVVGEGILRTPALVLGGAPLQRVAQFGLTDLGTLGSEALVEVLGKVVGEGRTELEALHDIGDFQTGGGVETVGMVVLGVGQQEAQRVHGITVDVAEVAAVLGDVCGILGGGTAEGTGIGTGRGIGLGAGGHVDGGENGAGVCAAGIGTMAAGVTPGQVFRNLDILVHLIVTGIMDAQILFVSTHQNTRVVLIVEGEAALQVLATVVEGNGVTLIESGAEDLIHPVGTGGGDPGVHAGVPAHGHGEAGVGIGGLAHLDLFLGVKGTGQVGSGTETGHNVILYMDALVALLGGHEDNTAGTGSSTVDSGGGGVLQDDDALDIVHGSDGGAGNTVNNPQHGVTIAGTLATDDDGRGGIRGTTVVGDGYTGNLALQHAFGVGHRTGSQFIGVVHDTHGSGQVLLLGLGTVTEGHGFLQQFGIFHEDDVDVGASVDVHLLSHITQAGNFEDCVGRNRDGVGTIEVRDSIGTTGENHGSRNGTHGITHGTTHCHVLGLRRESCHQAHECGSKT